MMIENFKKKEGIVDPWDTEPEKYRKKWKKEIPGYRELTIKLNPAYQDQNNANFVPEDLNYPDSSRYIILSYSSGNSDSLTVEDSFPVDVKSKKIKRIKKELGIVDPWDDDPLYFY